MKKNDKQHSYQLSIEYPRDFKIIFNKKTTFLVNPLVLSSVSDLFREKYFNGKITYFEVSERSNDKSFSDFLSLAHGQKVDLSLKTACSILKIAKTWKSPIIQNLIEKFLEGEPEVEVKIAEIIDDYDLLDLLPTVNTFKDKKKLLTDMFKTDSMHSIPPIPLQELLNIALSFQIDRNIIDSFIAEHFKRNPNLKPDFFNNSNIQNLSDEQYRFLFIDKKAKSAIINQTTNKLPNQGNVPQIEFSDKLKALSKKSKTSKPSKMLSLSQITNEKSRMLKMQEPYIGILAKISFESNGRPFKNEFIKVTTTSHDPQNFLNPTNNEDFIITTNDNKFSTKPNENKDESLVFIYPYIIFQLPISVSISSYSIRNSFKEGSKEWILYGTQDQTKWNIIDNQESPDEIIEPRETVKIDLEKKTEPYSSFKLVSSKYYPEDDAYELIISSVELFDDDEYSDGVFKKLTSENKYINVITSSNNPQVLISPRHKRIWYSINEPKQSITFQFLKHKVQPTKYTLKSGAFWHMRSWQLSGSYDGEKWFILDKKVNSMQMDRKFMANVYKIQQDYHICKFLRITQIGKTYDGMNILCLSGLEFFGNVESDESEGQRLNHNIRVFEEIRQSRGLPSPRSPRTPRTAKMSAPASPVSQKTQSRSSKTENKNQKSDDEKPHKEKKEKEEKQKQKEKEKEKKEKEKKEKEKKEKEEKQKEKEKKEEKEKKDKDDKKKDKDDKKKDKKDEKGKNDSDEVVAVLSSDKFTDSSSSDKESKGKEKPKKGNEKSSESNVLVMIDISDEDDGSDKKDKKETSSKNSKETSESIAISATEDFSSSSKSKSTDKKDTQKVSSDSDVISISESSQKADTDNKKETSSKNSKETSESVPISATEDFISSSKSKSTDVKNDTQKVSSDSDVVAILDSSDKTDTENKKETSSKNSKETSESVAISATEDFISSSKSKSTDKKDTQKVSSDSDVISISESSQKADTDNKKENEEEEKKKKEEKKSGSDSSDIATIFSDTDSDGGSKNNKSDDKDDKDDLNKVMKETSGSDAITVSDASSDSKKKDSKSDDSDVIVISDVTSDTNKDDDKKDTKSDDDVKVEISDDFESDSF